MPTSAPLPGRHALGTKPRSDESLISYIFRLAKRMGTPTGSLLARQAGLDNLTNSPDDGALCKLSKLANVSVEELRSISYGAWDPTFAVFRGMKLPTTLFKGNLAARSVCSSCLAEAAFHRAMWDLSFASACPVHRQEMVNTCPDCGRWLRWRGRDLTRCGCPEGDLTFIKRVPVEAGQLDGVAAAYGFLGDERFEGQAKEIQNLVPLRDLGHVEAFGFIYRLGMDLSPGARRKLFSLEQPGKLDVPPHVALNLGLQAARGWPETFLQAPIVIGEVWGLPDAKITSRWLRSVRRWLASLEGGQGRAIRLVADMLDNEPNHPGSGH